MGSSVPNTDVVRHLVKEMGTQSESDFTKLFIFDNFETASDPFDLYRWLDTYIRPQIKL